MTVAGMHLGFLGTSRSLSLDQIGGTESFARRLADAAIERGDAIHVALLGKEHPMAVPHRPEIRIGRHRRIGSALRALRECDTILVFHLPIRARLRLAWEHRFSNNHRLIGTTFAPSGNKLRQWLNQRLLQASVAGNIATSPTLRKLVARTGQPTVQILPPVPHAVHQDKKTRRKPEHVAYVGRADPGKGTETALAILNELAEDPGRMATARLYSWPDEPRPDLNALYPNVSIHHSNYSKWTRHLEGDIVEFLLDCDVLILPYRTKTNTIWPPLVVLEAVAAGVHVITSPVGDIPEVCGDTCTYIAVDGWSSESVLAAMNAFPEPGAQMAPRRDLLNQLQPQYAYDRLQDLIKSIQQVP